MPGPKSGKHGARLGACGPHRRRVARAHRPFQRLQAPQGVLATRWSRSAPICWQRLRASWEAVNNRWNQWVLNYTQSKQLNLLKNLGFDSPPAGKTWPAC
jgi:hypothetical protein